MKLISFRLRASNDQIQEMSRMCDMSEQLLALTLARHLEGKTAEESLQPICDWFRNVRHMAQAQFINSGIQVLPPVDRVEAVMQWLHNEDIALTERQTAELTKLLQ